MTQQRLASTVRQVLAVLAAVAGVVTASIPSLHLSPVVSGLLVMAGGIVLAVAHYVSDPSTGSDRGLQSYALGLTTGALAGPQTPRLPSEQSNGPGLVTEQPTNSPGLVTPQPSNPPTV